MDRIIKYLKKNGGYARMKDFRAESFHPRDVARLLENGTIEKVKPGLYKLPDIKTSAGNDMSLVDACHAVPQGVICLVSAISFYELITFNPSEIFVAIPHAWKPHRIKYPPIRFFYFRDRFHKPGMIRLYTKGGSIRIYSKEKTICDMFRYRNKLGIDLALEGLRNYLKLKDANIRKLREYAEICQVKTVMLPYVKAIVG